MTRKKESVICVDVGAALKDELRRYRIPISALVRSMFNNVVDGFQEPYCALPQEQEQISSLSDEELDANEFHAMTEFFKAKDQIQAAEWSSRRAMREWKLLTEEIERREKEGGS